MGNPTDKPIAPGSEEALINERERGLPVTLPKGAQDFRKTAEINPQLPIDNAITTTRQSYEALPPQRKAMMHLGFSYPNTDFETIGGSQLGNKKIISITTNNPGDSAKLAAYIVGPGCGIALPLETPIVHGSDSSTNTTLYLVAASGNIHVIAMASEVLGIPATLRISEHTSDIVRFADQLIPLDPAILAHTPTANIQGNHLQSAHWKADDIINHPISPNHKAQPFGEPFTVSQYMRNCSLQVAQKEGRTEKNIAEESSYLILDISSLLKDPKANNLHVKSILSKMASLAVSPDFFVTMDQQGNMVIVNRAQRSGSSIARLAREIEKLTKGRSNMFIGKGIFKKENKNFGIENYPNAETLVDWQNQGQIKPRVFFNETAAQNLTLGRDGTTIKFEVDVVPGTELLALRDLKRSANLHIGGPDRLIGYEAELEQMIQGTDPSGKTKLTIINGSAGSGKSRLANELLQKYPDALVHSVDASGENIPGAALSEMATTIKDAINTKLTDDVKQRHFVDISMLNSYANKPEEQKLSEAQKSPQGLVEIYSRCLHLLEASCGSFLFVIDDIHHIDRHSESYMMNLLERFLTGTHSKAMILRRPEETYHSTAQKNLARNINLQCQQRNEGRGMESKHPNYVETVNLNDPDTREPKLNIRDIAYEYAFYSLPEKIRVNFDTGKARDLGNWPRDLAGKCRTPLDFTSVLNSLLEDPENSFIIGSDNIALNPEKAKTISNINNDRDLRAYHQSRMRRLPTNSKAILQCVAILGSKVSFRNLQNIAKEVLKIEQQEIQEAIVTLGKGGYIMQHEDGGFEIQHDNYRDIALRSLDGEEKRKLITAVYEQFQDNPEIHNDRKFALLCEIAHDIPLNREGDAFWSHYKQRASQAMNDAARERAYSRGYSIAMTILNNLEHDPENTICNFIEILEINPSFDLPEHPPIRDLILKALFAVAKNGLNLGNFSKTTEAINKLEKLSGITKFPTEAYIIGFRAAYAQIDIDTMQEYYRKAKTRPDLKPSDDISMQIRLEFRNQKFKECKELFVAHKDFIESIEATDPQASDEFKRLKQRIAFEETRLHLENNEGIDGDVVLDPGHLDQSKTQEFIAILKELEVLESSMATNPDKFDPIQELQLKDQMAELYAFLGNYEKASASLSEVWRLAQQMQIPTEAARAAKSKGDIQIMQAISQIQAPTNKTTRKAEAIPNGTILRKNVIEALRTYTENGFTSLEKVEDQNEFQLIMRGQRMRAISILIRSYQNEIDSLKTHGETMASKKEIKAALAPYIKTALEDFDYISKSPHWGKTFTTPGLEGPYSYYATSSMGHVLQCIEDLGIKDQELGISIPNILNSNDFAAFNPESIEEGLKFAAMIKDNVGERNMGKLPGLLKIIELGGREAQRRKNKPKLSSFIKLRKLHQKISAQG